MVMLTRFLLASNPTRVLSSRFLSYFNLGFFENDEQSIGVLKILNLHFPFIIQHS